MTDQLLTSQVVCCVSNLSLTVSHEKPSSSLRAVANELMRTHFVEFAR